MGHFMGRYYYKWSEEVLHKLQGQSRVPKHVSKAWAPVHA